MAVYFWTMLLGSLGWSYVGQPVAAAVAATGAGILGGVNLLARDYFERHNDLGNRRDAGPIGGASVLTDELCPFARTR